MKRFSAALVLVSFAACASGTVAQAQATAASAGAATTTLSVDNNLVVVPAVVRDKKSALVRGIPRENFTLEVDGKAQAIKYFDTEADVPLTVGLLVDTSLSQREVIDDERTASATFLDKMLAPERDQAFVIQFAHDVDLLQDVTMSRGKLQAALKQIEVAKPNFGQGGNGGSGGNGGNDTGSGGSGSGGNDSGGGGSGGSQDRRHHGGGGPGAGGGGGSALYDAVFLASDEIMPRQKGRRALILLTDGDDRGSKETLAKSIEAAQRADTIVYAIYYKGHESGGEHGYGGDHGGGGGRGGGRRGGGGFPFPFAGEGQRGGGQGGGEGDGKKVLERMCGETGGRVFEVKGKQTVATIYADIADELRTQYRLGFTPTADAASEGYHQVALTLTGTFAKSKDVVQARDGYYPKAK